MPRGPKGEKRPADVIGNAVKVMRIAVGEEEEEASSSQAVMDRASKGGKARTDQLDKTTRQEIARKAAAARWQKK